MKRTLQRIRARVDFVRDVISRRALERRYRRNPPPIADGAEEIFLVEGFWDNPNHWLRLWIFLHAVLKDRKADVVAILRPIDNWDTWRKQKSLEALGIRRFIYLDKLKPDAATLEKARTLLQDATTPWDMLHLRLPEDMPAYTYFDTVIKHELHPQPKIEGNPVWLDLLADLLRIGDFYRDFFDTHKVVGAVSSHAWKSEWAAFCWTALRRGVPFYYMTAHYDSIRLRKMSSIEDYKTPNEHLPFAQFKALPPATQDLLVERGRASLAERFAGNSDFVVLRYSVNTAQRGQGRNELIAAAGLDPAKPLVVIYAHSWFDFPHTQAMKNFAEPLDWLMYTIETIKPLTDVNWAIKPHPCDRWYGVIRVVDIVKGLPPHIAVLPEDSDSLAIQSIADALVTIQGSIAIEAAAMGKAVLCADRGMYTPWGFTTAASSREDYAAKLRDIRNLPKPTLEDSRNALAYAATAMAPPAAEAGSLKLTCDTRFVEGTLYGSIEHLLDQQAEVLDREIGHIRRWLRTPFHSYNAWRSVDFSNNRNSAVKDRKIPAELMKAAP